MRLEKLFKYICVAGTASMKPCMAVYFGYYHRRRVVRVDRCAAP